MWKRKAKKAGGKGSTLIQTGKAAALAAKQQAQAQPVPVRHGGHNPHAARATAALTAAMLTKAAKQVVEEAPVKVKSVTSYLTTLKAVLVNGIFILLALTVKECMTLTSEKFGQPVKFTVITLKFEQCDFTINMSKKCRSNFK